MYIRILLRIEVSNSCSNLGVVISHIGGEKWVKSGWWGRARRGKKWPIKLHEVAHYIRNTGIGGLQCR